jgi:hypothetical protein
VSWLRAVLGSRYAGVGAVLLAGLAACQGVELGVGVKPAVPPPDPVVEQQVDQARTAVAAAEERAQEAIRVAAEAEAARVAGQRRRSRSSGGRPSRSSTARGYMRSAPSDTMLQCDLAGLSSFS